MWHEKKSYGLVTNNLILPSTDAVLDISQKKGMKIEIFLHKYLAFPFENIYSVDYIPVLTLVEEKKKKV